MTRKLFVAAVCIATLLAPGCKKKAENRNAPEPTAQGTTPTEPTEPAQANAPPATEPPKTETTPAETPPVAGEQPVESRLAFATGTVNALAPDGPQPLAEGDSVPAGTIIIVEADGQAELDLPDGSMVDLDETTELLVREAWVSGNVRTIDLEVLDGGIRVSAAPNTDPASTFVVRTVGGEATVKGTEFAIEIGAEANLSQLVVFEGKVELAAGEVKQEVTPAEDAKPVAVTVAPEAGIKPVEVPAALVEAWSEWNNRQADVLLQRHGLDIANPAATAPQGNKGPDPRWQAQTAVRHARIAARAQALADALGPEKLQELTETNARFEAAKAAWGQTVSAERHRINAERQAARREAWQTRTEARQARQEELRARLGQIRAEQAARGHGRDQGRNPPPPPAEPPPAPLPLGAGGQTGECGQANPPPTAVVGGQPGQAEEHGQGEHGQSGEHGQPGEHGQGH